MKTIKINLKPFDPSKIVETEDWQPYIRTREGRRVKITTELEGEIEELEVEATWDNTGAWFNPNCQSYNDLMTLDEIRLERHDSVAEVHQLKRRIEDLLEACKIMLELHEAGSINLSHYGFEKESDITDYVKAAISKAEEL